VCRGRARRAGVSSSCKSPAFGAPVSETPLLDEQYILCLSIDTSHTLLPFHSNRLLLSIPVPPPCQYLPQPITTLLLTGYHARMHMLRLTRSLSLSLYIYVQQQPTNQPLRNTPAVQFDSNLVRRVYYLVVRNLALSTLPPPLPLSLLVLSFSGHAWPEYSRGTHTHTHTRDHCA
jgi:hypothetical protein